MESPVSVSRRVHFFSISTFKPKRRRGVSGVSMVLRSEHVWHRSFTFFFLIEIFWGKTRDLRNTVLNFFSSFFFLREEKRGMSRDCCSRHIFEMTRDDLAKNTHIRLIIGSPLHFSTYFEIPLVVYSVFSAGLAWGIMAVTLPEISLSWALTLSKTGSIWVLLLIYTWKIMMHFKLS